MRARRRRSVLNTVSAAVLEVAIMGLFVIIAQPQLRDALFEILHAGQPTPAAQSAANHRSTATTQPALNLDRTMQAVVNSPVGQAIESSINQWANVSRPEMNVPSLYSQPKTAPSLLPSTAVTAVTSGPRDQPVQSRVTAYSPYDQYESFRVSVPANNQAAFQQPAANGYAAASNQHYAVPQYVPPQSYGAPTYAPTQLNANQWNIASAPQSPRPNASSNNWIPSQVTETSFRQVVPPPYGTQNMWK